MTTETASFIILAITGIFAGVAAFAAMRAVQETRKSVLAQIMSSLLDAYASDEMLTAMRLLNKWAKEHGANFADEYGRRLREEYRQVEDVEYARRRVSHYFEKIYALWEQQLIDERIVRAVASAEQVKFLREKVEPLEAALNPKYKKSIFDKFGSLYSISSS